MAETITDRIRQAIDASGLKQAEIARRVGVERQTVGDWYHGRSVNVRPDHLFALADVLGVEARWLAVGTGPRERISPLMSNYTRAIASLTPEAREALLIVLGQKPA